MWAGRFRIVLTPGVHKQHGVSITPTTVCIYDGRTTVVVYAINIFDRHNRKLLLYISGHERIMWGPVTVWPALFHNSDGGPPFHIIPVD